MILLKPTGGLCNRLRTIDSGLVLSRQIQQPLHVLWTLGPELNCGFYSLFEPSPEFQVTDVRLPSPPASPRLKKLAFLRDYLSYRRKYRCVIFQSRMTRLLSRNFDFTRLRKYDSIFITCCNRFYRPERKLQPFLPIAPIRQIADTYIKAFSDHTVGVHIRRTDHHTVTSYGPEQGFRDAMNAEIEKCPQTTFYLATDSQDIQFRFTALFGHRILWHPKDFGRNNPKGIEDALVDLWCLSKTKKVIGSHLSSFSETAVQMNDIPLSVIKGD
jgi:hypothetical protein